MDSHQQIKRQGRKSPVMARLLFGVTRFLAVRKIMRINADTSQSAYLERYNILRTRHLTIYLHRFVDRDQDRELHDHPWHGLALVLSGSYQEQYLLPGLGVGERKVRFFNLINANSFHMISSARPETWTLFIHGRKIKKWGFLSGMQGDQANYRVMPDSDQDWHKKAPAEPREPLKHII